jgi:hypothetical protein
VLGGLLIWTTDARGADQRLEVRSRPGWIAAIVPPVVCGYCVLLPDGSYCVDGCRVFVASEEGCSEAGFKDELKFLRSGRGGFMVRQSRGSLFPS